MAPVQRAVETTESTCTTKAVRGTHVFKIDGYSLHKGIGAGNFIRSATFTVGGHRWCVRFYPDGDGREDSADCVSVHLERRSKGTDVRAFFGFRLTKKVTGLSFLESNTPMVFKNTKLSCGYKRFMKRTDLEASQFLQKDRLVIVCDVAVITGTSVSESEPVCEIQVPPADLSDNLRKLLESEEGVDVTFMVGEETFNAHKVVLAMRSPVFKAELYGPMMDTSTRSITVEDMQPAAFKALLHFIYTDSLPAMDDLDGDEYRDMIKHLLAAADRYAIERMKCYVRQSFARNLM
ncbi:hypothetical protein ACP70R_003126 [Stipagrostis hirtigluma subsp. patula]